MSTSRVVVSVVVVLVAYCVGIAHAAVSEECEANPTCLLTKLKCQKPIPSLTQCYKYNQESCCVAGHDAVIKDEYESLWSSTCIREYANLEVLYCLGCNLNQGKFVNETTKVVRVCQSFADQLFDFTSSTRTLYDNCGVLQQNGDVLLPGVATDTNGAPLFQNATAFLNYAYTYDGVGGTETAYPFRSPFFKDYSYVVVPDSDIGDCFTAASAKVVLSMLSSVLVAVVALILA